MNLDDLIDRDFVLDLPGGAVRRPDVHGRARELESAVRTLGRESSIVEVPASDPFTLLAWMEAAWRTGRVPLPRASARAPAATAIEAPNAALVLVTSGSTGEPKHVTFTMDAVRTSARRIAASLSLDPTDRFGILQPLEHGFGLVGQLFAAMASGARSVWAHSPYPEERATALRTGDVTVAAAVPFVLGQIVDAKVDLPSLRALGSAGGRLPLPLVDRLSDRFPEVTLWNQYGCTEAGPRLTACSSREEAFHRGSVGRPIEGVSLRILEDGEIAFATTTSMTAYAGDPVGTNAKRAGDAWWRTGDIGRLDAEGYLEVTGRHDDVVKIRGSKVPLRQVERAFEACGATAALALLGPSRDGAEPTLWTVYEGAKDISRRALLAHVPLEHLPSGIRRVDALPRRPNGKVDLRAVARWVESEQTSR